MLQTYFAVQDKKIPILSVYIPFSKMKHLFIYRYQRDTLNVYDETQIKNINLKIY